jgi:hypothetical protein
MAEPIFPCIPQKVEEHMKRLVAQEGVISVLPAIDVDNILKKQMDALELMHKENKPIVEEYRNLTYDGEVSKNNYHTVKLENELGLFKFVGKPLSASTVAPASSPPDISSLYVGKLECLDPATSNLKWVAYGKFFHNALAPVPLMHGMVRMQQAAELAYPPDKFYSYYTYRMGEFVPNTLVYRYIEHETFSSFQFLDKDGNLSSNPEQPSITLNKKDNSIIVMVKTEQGGYLHYSILRRSPQIPIPAVQMWSSLPNSPHTADPNSPDGFIDETGTYGRKVAGKGIFLGGLDTARYEGELSSNFRYWGQGVLSFKQPPTRVTGKFEDGAVIHGHLECPEFVYEGQFSNAIQNGKGKVQYANGDVYEGDFRMSQMEGRGMYKYANGDLYEGEMRGNMFDGYGTMKLHNGIVFKGEFEMNSYKKGRLDVPFQAYDCSDNVTHGTVNWGFFGGVMMLGKCAKIAMKSLKYKMFGGDPWLETYEGSFDHERNYEGHGTLKDCFGTEYVGEFMAGQKSGTGSMKLPNGDHYMGEFSMDMPNGKGKMILKNGDTYVGEFRNGMYDGIGILTEARGKVQKGTWKEGKLVEEQKDEGNGGNSTSGGSSGTGSGGSSGNSGKVNFTAFEINTRYELPYQKYIYNNVLLTNTLILNRQFKVHYNMPSKQYFKLLRRFR